MMTNQVKELADVSLGGEKKENRPTGTEGRESNVIKRDSRDWRSWVGFPYSLHF